MRQKAFAVLFTCVMAVLVIMNVRADNDSFQNSIGEEQSKINDKEQKLGEIQSLLSGLNQSKDDLDQYMVNLKDSYNAINTYVENLKLEAAEKQSQIDAVNVELERARTTQTEQYEAMKMRIKYMYETGDAELIQVLFSDAPLSEILNRVEYTAELLEYDRAKLEEYGQLLTYIEAARLKLEKEINELDALMAEQGEKQSEMSSMMAQASVNIRKKENEIDEAESKAQALSDEIQKGRDTIEELKEEESKRIAESIRQSIEQESRENAGESMTTAPSVDYIPEADDLMKLAAILYCEARGEPYEGIIAVGTVVMNRVADPRFPNTVEEVILAPDQFAPVASGHYAIALAIGANETCIKAAQEVLYGGVRTGNWLYFRTVNNIIQGDIIGHHVFYYR